MKLLSFFLFAALVSVYAEGNAQNITMSGKDLSLRQIFAVIEQQTGYFVFADADLVGSAKKVSVNANKMPLKDFLDMVLKNQPFSYEIRSKTIALIPLPNKENVLYVRSFDIDKALPPLTIRVFDEDGNPLSGASVLVRNSKTSGLTDEAGALVLDVKEKDVLNISFIGFESKLIRVSGSMLTNGLTIKLEKLNQKMDEVEVVSTGYWTTSRKLSTGNIGKVTSKEIENQPVSNPLAALQGRVPGMIVTQTTGVPGGAFKVEVRGRTALDRNITDDQPLFVVDGVPMAANNQYLGSFISALGYPTTSTTASNPGGLSPFNSINPDDIEQIEVLKDADATAIYGARGANGVILITTKKGRSGAANVGVNLSSGFSRVTRRVNMMNTSQYITMRKEAFANDGITMTPANAFDILVWDTTKYFDYQDKFLGGTAWTHNAQVSLSGGSQQTTYHLSGAFFRESSIYPTDAFNQRGSMMSTLSHHSLNKRFNLGLSINYSSTNNQVPTSDLARDILTTPPHTVLLNEEGDFVWYEPSIPISNPYAALTAFYNTKVDNLISSLQLSYALRKNLTIKTSMGLNQMNLNEHRATPGTARNPGYSEYRHAGFGNQLLKSWIIEPQLEWSKALGSGSLEILAGGTIQQQVSSGSTIEATGFSSDDLLGSVVGATNISAERTLSEYKYAAMYGRINYNYDDKYIVNLSARRDGSSRFGPGKQFANFGAVGAAWVFSNEGFLQQALPFISFGKIRGSYGITGNDKISDYQYLDTYVPENSRYQDSASMKPGKLFNPDYQWEQTQKLELAIELGLFRDRLTFSAAWYRNTSSNQLVQYRLPRITGFTNVISNLPATVLNSGLELYISTINIKNSNFEWTTTANVTLPKNKLLSFPNLVNSSYYASYVLGKPLNSIYNYKYLGVDPETGFYELEDLNKDGRLSIREDYQASGHLDPKFYGGIRNNLRYRNFDFSFFIEFRNQQGINWMERSSTPGSVNNFPVFALDRWQQPGDIAGFRKFTTRNTSMPYNLRTHLNNTTGMYGNASFAKLRNVALAYKVPFQRMGNVPVTDCKLFINAQNLFTLTSYVGSDPEVQNYLRTSPLRTIVFGVQMTF